MVSSLPWSVRRLVRQGVERMESWGLKQRLFLPLAALTLALAPAAARAAKPEKAPAGRLVKLTLTPTSGVLTGPEARQTLVVNAVYSDGSVRDVTSKAKFASKSPKVLKVSPGLAQAVGDGKGQLTASF